MSKIVKHTVFLFLTVFIISSCGSKKQSNPGEVVDKKKTNELLDSLEAYGNKDFSFFYSKIACKYKSDEQNLSFKTTIKLKSDSLLNAMMTFAKIPVVIANVSQDSVKLINKRDKCYFFSEIDFLSSLLNMDLALSDAEDIILGSPLAFDRKNKYHQLPDTSFYVIATHKEKEFEDKNGKDIMMKYFLSADSLELKKTFIASPKDSTEITIDMEEYQLINNKKYPYVVKISASSKKGPVHIELKYTKVAIDEPVDIYFKIPDNYVECE